MDTNPHRLRRRNFLRSLTAAIPACALGGSLGGQENRGMFLALNPVLVNNRVPWPEFAKLAAKTGWPGVDILLNGAMRAGSQQTSELLKQLRLRPAAINFPVAFDKSEEAFRKGLAALPAQSKFAREVGCPRMVTAVLSSSATTPKAELRALFKKRFQECARVMADDGVRLGLEFLGPLQFRRQRYEFIWRMSEMLEFTKECGSNVGLLLDAWHWHHAGATVDDIVKAGRDRIVHVHFDDAAKLPPEQVKDDQRLLPGEGVINLVGLLRALQQIGYRDALSVEVFGRVNGETPETASRMGLEASRKVLQKAGLPT